ncbi:MAG: mandelate racemase/muconate lactonizing enzyme family protein [Firmicutes bacterium]|nr:mandelate racemase/muconate lactonizing enzyme family protein [Bacillota bacterium]MCL5039628.1 mandelate racemase/muconate lactonizing enzyme family protein [Bacillota bacterium]
MKITNVEAITLVVPMERPIKAPISIPHADELAGVVFKEYRTTLVRITTDEDLVGVGESMVRLAPTATRDIVEYLKPILIGKDPFDIERIWDLLYGAMMNRGHYKGFFIEAVSGIDVALWDIMGKALNMPVYKLLGGKTKEKIWTYASSLRFRGLDVLKADAQRYLDMGYNAMKIKIGQNPMDYRKDIEVVSQLRKVVGDDVVLMVDANCAYGEDVKTALEVGKAMEDLGIFWFEEPLSPDNVEGYAYLRKQMNIRLAAGEAEFTRFGFRPFFVRGALDIVQPNLCRTGGFTEAKKIAAMASAFHVAYAPHTGSSSAIAMAAAMHLAVALPNFLIYEHMESDWSKDQKNPLRWDLTELPIKSFKDSYIELDDKPGLGIELNEEIVNKYRVG